VPVSDLIYLLEHLAARGPNELDNSLSRLIALREDECHRDENHFTFPSLFQLLLPEYHSLGTHYGIQFNDLGHTQIYLHPR
jgi:hypothetical protein